MTWIYDQFKDTCEDGDKKDGRKYFIRSDEPEGLVSDTYKEYKPDHSGQRSTENAPGQVPCLSCPQRRDVEHQYDFLHHCKLIDQSRHRLAIPSYFGSLKKMHTNCPLMRDESKQRCDPQAISVAGKLGFEKDKKLCNLSEIIKLGEFFETEFGRGFVQSISYDSAKRQITTVLKLDETNSQLQKTKDQLAVALKNLPTTPCRCHAVPILNDSKEKPEEATKDLD
jgi:hypothetical protein